MSTFFSCFFNKKFYSYVMNIPLEHDEAVQFVEWLDYNNVDRWHIPNETWTNSWKRVVRYSFSSRSS